MKNNYHPSQRNNDMKNTDATMAAKVIGHDEILKMIKESKEIEAANAAALKAKQREQRIATAKIAGETAAVHSIKTAKVIGKGLSALWHLPFAGIRVITSGVEILPEIITTGAQLGVDKIKSEYKKA